jgi:HSP20 family protein
MFDLTPFKKNQGISMENSDFWNIDSMFENFFSDSMFPIFYSSSWKMKVDIKDNGNEYIFEAELPGVTKEELNIELNNNNLTISVTKNEQVNEERANYIRRERRQNSMSRSFYVDDVDIDKIDAKFNNGILSIILPKKEPGRPKNKKIDIH